MSALPQALPLAISAAIYPPAVIILLLLLVSEHPRRLVLAYFAGAATLTVGAGLIGLAVVSGAGATSSDSRTTSGWVYIAIGILLAGVTAWAWRRRARAPAEPAEAEEEPRTGRIAEWTQRATTSQKWALALGLVMFLPSPLYLLAIKTIADSGDSTTSNIVAVLICAAGVLLLVEIPVVGMFVRPDGIVAAIRRGQDWTKRNGWTIAAVVAGLGAILALAKGIDALG
jgi:uncharacterized membrane protein YidH (DUF202 family)